MIMRARSFSIAHVMIAIGVCLVLACHGTRASGRAHVARYTAPVRPAPSEFEAATAAWRWLLPPGAEPLLITALGDVFVRTNDGRVMFLDTETGKLENVAGSLDEWDGLLRDGNAIETWFRPTFIAELERRHDSLKAPLVFSPTTPSVLGGELTAENYTPSRWDAHLHIMGQIHRQVRDLPSGTPITKIHVEPW